ncbi:hypothetical protein GCM10027072_77050 [Streptomyces bullii]
MILARALTLRIAARHPDRVVATEPLVNELRHKAVGTDLDVGPCPPMPSRRKGLSERRRLLPGSALPATVTAQSRSPRLPHGTASLLNAECLSGGFALIW